MARHSRHMVAALAAAATALALVPVAAAKDGDVRATGTCSSASAVKLKLSDEDGRIEVELEVDQNRNGVSWNVVMKRNGTRFFKGVRKTAAASGSLTVRRLVTNGSGADRIFAKATRAGETCTVRATF